MNTQSQAVTTTKKAVKSYPCHMDENHIRTLYNDGSTTCETLNETPAEMAYAGAINELESDVVQAERLCAKLNAELRQVTAQRDELLAFVQRIAKLDLPAVNHNTIPAETWKRIYFSARAAVHEAKEQITKTEQH